MGSRIISVFIASPSDLAPERQAFKSVIDELNGGFGDGLGVQFRPLGWEDVLASTGRRSQSVINEEVNACDVFILVLHRRWGQPAPDSAATSYTEEEYRLALGRWQTTGKPTIFIFFKNVDAASLADPGPELEKVISFKRKLESQRDTIYRTFNTESDFVKEVDAHLREFARKGGALPSSNLPMTIQFDPATLAAPTAGPKVDQRLVREQVAETALARSAMEAARQGRLQEAELLFAKAVEGTTNLDILDAAAQFYRQRGQVDSATELVARHAALAQDRMVAARHLIAVLPLDMMNYMVEQMIEQLFTGQPPEFAQEFRAIAEEVFAPSRLEAVLQDLYSRHYTAAEMLALARAFASAEGHAAQRKTPMVTLEMMNWGGREFERVAEQRQRRREADTFEAAEPPKRIG